MSDSTPTRTLGDKLQSLPRLLLFIVLFFAAAVPLFIPVSLPNKPQEPAIAFYKALMTLKPGDKVLLGSDWTLGTRAESGGEMEAVLRIFIRRGIKFAVYATSDVNAPTVARDTIATITKDEAAHGQPLFKPFKDYVVCGFFPNSEGTTQAINVNVRNAFAGRKDYNEQGAPTDVLESPVFDGINSLSDFKFLVLVSPTNSEKITIQRIKKTPMLFMVTGVMTPEDTVYYASGQLKGLIGGVKGVFDLETLMEKGTPDGVPGFPGQVNAGKGTKYYLALHACLALLVISVLIGNIGMWLNKRGQK